MNKKILSKFQRFLLMLSATIMLSVLLLFGFPSLAQVNPEPIPRIEIIESSSEMSTQAQLENQSRRERGNQVINKLTGGAGQPVLDALRQDFPFLADAIIDYSLGEVWSRQGLDDRTRQLATIAAFAATGNLPQLKIHAGYALGLGVTQDELKEIIYLTTVTAGFPRSIDAAQALREVFAAQSKSSSTAK